MKKFIILAFAVVTVTAYAQEKKAATERKPASGASKTQTKGKSDGGIKTTATGLQYKIFVDKPGKTAQVGEFIKMDMVVKNSKDSTLRNTYKEGQPVQAPIQQPPFKGSLEEGFLMLSEGDSAEFLISADSLFEKPRKQPMPPFIEKGSKLKFIVKIHKVLTQEDLQKEQEMAQQKQIEQDESLIKDYITKNNLQAQRTSSGLYYVVKEKGTGAQAKAGDTVKVHYTGKLLDGKVFDSSVQRGVPFEFTLGQGMVIRGWDEGIALMNVGEKGTLLIPSGLGYGQRGAGGAIPPNAVLIFDVELIGKK